MESINFRATSQQQERPLATDWRERVSSYLATIPQAAPADDLQLIHMALRGEDIGTPTQVQRVKLLMRGAHDATGHVTIAGQLALLTELRHRLNHTPEPSESRQTPR